MRPAACSTLASGPPISIGVANGSEDVANIEMDLYAGIKPKTGRITWDLGVIYYAYPNSVDLGGFNNDFVEIKVGGSAEVWKDGTLGVTVFFSPDYQYETGNVWTVEARVLTGLAEDWYVLADLQRLARLSDRR